MKKAILLALCLVLVGMLAVDDTFAADFTQLVNNTFSFVFQTIEGLINPAPTVCPADFDIELVYTDSAGNPLTASTPPQLMPGSTVDRFAAVANRSAANSAYFCMAMAVQADVEQLLTIEVNTTDYTWSDWMDITIGGVSYKMKLATYNSALEAQQQSPAALQRVSLSVQATTADLMRFRDDFLQLQVLVIDTAEFSTSPADALEAALQITSTNHPFQ